MTLDELRAMRNRLQDEDDAVSYVRRVAQARLDLVRAARAQRAGADHSEDLSSELRAVLSSQLTSGVPRPPRPVENLADNAMSAELDQVCADHGFGRLEHLSVDEIQQLEVALNDFERRVSDDRRARFERLDVLSAELVRRYRDGEATVDGLLG